MALLPPLLVLACLAACPPAASAWTPNFSDSTLNVSQIASIQPESLGRYLGSPSLLRVPGSGVLLASHDEFGPGATSRAVLVRASRDGGQTWADAGPRAAVADLQWATLFARPGDGAVYLLGVSNDGGAAQAAISRSLDGGATWSSPATRLTASNASFSTGPTPVLLAAGRLWRALEHNTRPGWATGYAACVLSARADAPDLLDAGAWTLSGELPFAGAVAARVPAAWARPDVASAFGWLEGGAVDPGDGGASGVRVLLRVNSLPAANKAALLALAAPGAAPAFVQWVDPFPGGMSKFTVRRDAATGLFVALANNVSDDGVSLPPTCAAAAPPPPGPLPCCGFLTACAGAGAPSCLWCRAVARNVLTLSVSDRLEGGWRVAATVLADDTGAPAYVSELLTGFQYADWQFDGDAGEDIVYAVRAAYRGGNQYHNANRHLFGIIPAWRTAARAALARVVSGGG